MYMQSQVTTDYYHTEGPFMNQNSLTNQKFIFLFTENNNGTILSRICANLCKSYENPDEKILDTLKKNNLKRQADQTF